MRRVAILSLISVSLMLSVASSTLAQSPGTGFPPFGSFTSSSFDAANDQDLNTIFSIPIVHSPGRGTDLNLSVVYNSQLWGISGGAWTPVTDQLGNPTFGWGEDFAGGKITYSAVTSQIKCYVDGSWFWDYKIHYFNYKYVDVMGTLHGFLSVSVIYNDCSGTTTGTTTAYADDSSGYYLGAGTPDAPFVRSPGGIYSPGGTVIDTNGNYTTKTVVSSTENDWTDTAGRIALKVVTIPSSITYSFLDPSGGYPTAVLNLQNTNIKTAFGCTGVIEYTGSAYLPSTLVLPNGKSYSFTYEPTPGASGYFTGRVQKVTLPTGGYYEYDYGATNDGANCADGSTVNLTRKISVDGVTIAATWTFVRNVGLSSTTVTAPTATADQTVYTFDTNAHETSRKMYQGSSSSGALLRTINTTWAVNSTPATKITILEDSNHTQNEVETTFDSFGNLQVLKEHDWGTGTPGGVLRTTTLTYVSSSAYINLNILNLLAKETVADSGGAIQSRTDITYDETGKINTSCPVSIPQHDDAGHGCSFTTRGLPTTVTTYPTHPEIPSGGIAKHFTYDWFGNLRTADLNCCQEKTWAYSTATQYSQPDSVTSGSSSPTLTTRATYNQYTGQVATSTNENGKVTTFVCADPGHMNRLTNVTRPDSAQITYAYDDTGRTVMVTSPVTSTSTVKQVTAFDGLGRQSTTSFQDSSNNTYAILQTQYDSMSRAYRSSNPYTSAPSYWTQIAFDPLGRPTSVLLPDNSATTYTYAANTVTITDPAGKQRKTQSDGLGRLAEVLEPDGNGNLNQQTSYAYNVLDALTMVTGAGSTQTRTYGYDHMGRLTSVSTPEANNVPETYQYDNFNNLTQRSDPRGVITTYGYDTLNRVQSLSYDVTTNNTGVAATPSVSFTFGTNSAQNNNGRLITMTDGAGSENYSYDANLSLTTQVQKVVSGTTYTTGYQYNLAGELRQITYPSGRIVQQSFDAIGRLCAIAQTSSGCTSNTNPYATGYGYNAAFELTGFNYANGVAASFGYSPDRLQITSLSYVKGTTTLFSLNYLYGTTGSNNGQILGITDNVENGRTATYTYDALARLSTAVTTGSTNYPKWGLSWTYDQYGNRLKQNTIPGTCVSPMSCPTNSVTVDPTSNHITDPGYGYDANGNIINDGENALTYDAENHLLTSSGILGSGTYVYDGNGWRVKKCVPNCISPTTTTVYVFSGTKVIAEYVNGAAPGSPTREYIYSGSLLLAKIESGATQYYHADHLSTRVMTDSNGNEIGEQGHFPYGETWYPSSPITKWEFTSYERDSESGNDYAMARSHVNRLGRFSSPDLLSGSTGDPQSLNRYTYVLDDPIHHVDPLGMDCEEPTQDQTCTSNNGMDSTSEGRSIIEQGAPLPNNGIASGVGPPNYVPLETCTGATETSEGGFFTGCQPVIFSTYNHRSDGGGGGGGQGAAQKQCTLNISVKNDVNASPDQIDALEGRLAATLGNTSSPVSVDFSFSGTPDFTVNVTNASAFTNYVYNFPWGGHYLLGGASGNVYVNNIPDNLWSWAAGTTAAHELGHGLIGSPELAYDKNNPNIMMLTKTPEPDALTAFLNPNSSPLLQFSSAQAAAILDKCLRLRGVRK